MNCNEAETARFNETHELDSAVMLSGLRFRANFYKTINGPACVCRRVESKIPDMDQFNLPQSLYDIIDYHKGLVLVTGPTGSGKSTTLAAIVNEINKTRTSNIITVEDPVEYFHHSNQSLINQRELGATTHSFGNALRAALREDPDVILVGEMRDLETISLALTAAETGHLVLSTLHTSSAVKAVDRIIDIFPSSQKGQIRSMMSESLEAVIAQKLIPTKDGKGRTPACEVMMATTAIRNLIREDRIYQIESVMQSGGVEGMQTLDQDLQRLVTQGKIDRSIAAQIANNPKLFGSDVL